MSGTILVEESKANEENGVLEDKLSEVKQFPEKHIDVKEALLMFGGEIPTDKLNSQYKSDFIIQESFNPDDISMKQDYENGEIRDLKIRILNGISECNSDPVVCDEILSNPITVTEEKPYRCHICGKLFSRNSSLKCHVRLHIEGPENILRCGSVASTDQSPEISPVLHNSTDIKAEILDETSYIFNENKQTELTNGENSYCCVFCDKTFSRKSGLKCHIQFHIKTFQNVCGDQGQISVSDEVLVDVNENAEKMGFLSVAKEKEYECVICDKMFPKKTDLIIHYKFHPAIENEIENHVKSSDPMENRTNNNFSKTVSRRNSTQTVRPETQNGISDAVAGTAAEESNENEDGKQYKCYICDKQFARNSSLMWHIQFHETYMYPKLKKSNQVNGTVSGLKRNLNVVHKSQASSNEDETLLESTEESTVENGEFKCEICDRSFTQMSSLRNHLRIHDSVGVERKVRSCTCEMCGKTFSTASNMTKHATFHCKGRDVEPTLDKELPQESLHSDENEGEYKCDHCDRIFCSMRAMRIHSTSQHKLQIDISTNEEGSNSEFLLVETGENNVEKPSKLLSSVLIDDEGNYKCDECDKTFGSIRNMKIHYAHAHHSKWDDNYFDDATIDEDTEIGDGIKCPVCHKTFDSVRGMKIHANCHKSEMSESNKNFENGENALYKCNLCSETFTEFKSYKKHVGWHSRRGDQVNDVFDENLNNNEDCDAEIKCDYCDRTFANMYAKAGHMKIHSKHPPAENDKTIPSRTVAMHTSSNMSEKNNIDTKTQNSIETSTNDKLIPCRVCGKLYTGAGMGGHMRLHRARVTSTDETLMNHATTIKTVNNERYPPLTSYIQVGTIDELLYCDVCNMTFIRKQDLSKHVRMHLSGMTKEDVDMEIHRCKFCERSFAGRKSLNTHIAYHHKSSWVTSTLTVKGKDDVPSNKNSEAGGVKRSSSLRINADSPSSKRFCDVRVTSTPQEVEKDNDDNQGKRKKRSTLTNSFYEYETVTSYKCDECGKSFPTKLGLQRHGTVHKQVAVNKVATEKPNKLEDMPFECVYCEMCFNKKEVLLAHVQLHEEGVALNTGDVAYKNDVLDDIDLGIGEHFVLQNMEGGDELFIFEQHEESEGYQCSECDESYLDKLQMIIHMSYHMGKRKCNGHAKPIIVKADSTILAPYTCRFCEERFINKMYRCRHILKRHRSSVFQCDSCKKLFLSKSSLQLHCREHTADTKNRCDYCSKYFTSKWFLKRHMRKQCPEKSTTVLNRDSVTDLPTFSHHCEFCELVFNDKNSLTEHLQVHVITYNCENCDFQCENVTELYTHACILVTEV